MFVTGFKIYFQPQNCRKVDASPHQEKMHGPRISVLWHLDVNHISKAILHPICPSSIDNQNDCVKSAFFGISDLPMKRNTSRFYLNEKIFIFRRKNLRWDNFHRGSWCKDHRIWFSWLRVAIFHGTSQLCLILEERRLLKAPKAQLREIIWSQKRPCFPPLNIFDRLLLLWCQKKPESINGEVLDRNVLLQGKRITGSSSIWKTPMEPFRNLWPAFLSTRSMSAIFLWNGGRMLWSRRDTIILHPWCNFPKIMEQFEKENFYFFLHSHFSW